MKNCKKVLLTNIFVSFLILTTLILSGCKSILRNDPQSSNSKNSHLSKGEIDPREQGVTIIDRAATIDLVRQKAKERKEIKEKIAQKIVMENAHDKKNCPIYQYEDKYRISKLFLRHDGKYSVNTYENTRGKWLKSNNIMKISSNNGAVSLYEYHNKKGDYSAIKGSLGYLIRKR
jgi:hypothetical protein